jgi:hypothetical protein
LRFGLQRRGPRVVSQHSRCVGRRTLIALVQASRRRRLPPRHTATVPCFQPSGCHCTARVAGRLSRGHRGDPRADGCSSGDPAPTIRYGGSRTCSALRGGFLADLLVAEIPGCPSAGSLLVQPCVESQTRQRSSVGSSEPRAHWRVDELGVLSCRLDCLRSRTRSSGCSTPPTPDRRDTKPGRAALCPLGLLEYRRRLRDTGLLFSRQVASRLSRGHRPDPP